MGAQGGFLGCPVSFPVNDCTHKILGLPEVRLGEPRARRNQKTTKRVFGVTSISAGQLVCVHKSSLHNMIVSLEQRVFRVKNSKGEFDFPPLPEKEAFTSCIAFRNRWLSALLSHGPVEISSIDRIVECYSAEKKKLYRAAADTLRNKPICRKDAQVSAFIKVEKLECDAKEPVPRTIQPRSKRYNLVLGKYLRLNENRMIHAIDEVFGERTVLSGLDNVAQGAVMKQKWDRYPNCVGIGLDASRFDQHCSEEALKFEHTFYSAAFKDHEELNRVLSWQLKNKGLAILPTGESVRYQTTGCRMSGDINTSLGNKLLMCSMVWTYLREHEIRASLANNGDDCVLFASKDQLEAITTTLQGWFLKRGYTMVVEEPVEHLEQVVFCRSQPVCVSGVWKMVRQLGSLSRDCYSTHDWSNETTFKDSMNALGQCNGIINDGVPVHMEQARCMWRAGGERNFRLEALKKFMEWGWRDRLGERFKLLWSPVADSTRLSYFRAFGVEPAVQLEVEAYFRSVVLTAGEQTIPSLPTHHSRIHKDLLKAR